MPGLEKIDLKSEFGHSNPELIKIISSLLEFNPNFRLSASELLQNPIFDSIRDLKMEKDPHSKIFL